MITKTRKRIYNKPLTITKQKIIAIKMIIELYAYHKPKKARRKMIKKACFMVLYKLMERIWKCNEPIYGDGWKYPHIKGTGTVKIIKWDQEEYAKGNTANTMQK